MHTVFALLCFVVVIHWLIFPYPTGLLHWHCGNLTIAPVPAKQPWWIWINTSCEFIMNDCITTTKQSTTKPCAYFLGYTVGISYPKYGVWDGMPLICVTTWHPFGYIFWELVRERHKYHARAVLPSDIKSCLKILQILLVARFQFIIVGSLLNLTSVPVMLLPGRSAALSRVSYGMITMGILKKSDHIIKSFHCNSYTGALSIHHR